MHHAPASPEDHDAIWAILEPIIRAGETYALDRSLSREAALAYWFGPGHQVFAAHRDGRVIGTWYLRTNQPGGGAHVCNCGFAVAADCRGVGRAMGEKAIAVAREQGFAAMQFNFVIASNERAVGLWLSLGFAEVGRLPRAFAHPRLGLVDALVMFRGL